MGDVDGSSLYIYLVEGIEVIQIHLDQVIYTCLLRIFLKKL